MLCKADLHTRAHTALLACPYVPAGQTHVLERPQTLLEGSMGLLGVITELTIEVVPAKKVAVKQIQVRELCHLCMGAHVCVHVCVCVCVVPAKKVAVKQIQVRGPGMVCVWGGGGGRAFAGMCVRGPCQDGGSQADTGGHRSTDCACLCVLVCVGVCVCVGVSACLWVLCGIRDRFK